jgi:hypothetical protein
MPNAKLFVTNEPDATAGDHLTRAAVPSAVAVAAARDIPRLRAGLTATLALVPILPTGRARPSLSTPH